MRRRPLLRLGCAVALPVLLIALWGPVISRPPVVSAHPLGNFTINRYSRIEPFSDVVYVHYVLDMAEIPTFQEMARIDLDRDGLVSEEEHTAYLVNKVKELQSGLRLSVNSAPVPLEIVAYEMSFPPGQGGLPTLRLVLHLQGEFRQSHQGVEQSLDYQDDNYARRLGWKEIVVKPGPGISLLQSTVPQGDRSDELRNYPQDMLNSPPDQQEAHLVFIVLGPVQAAQAQSGPRTAPPEPAPRDAFVALVTADRLSLPVVILSFFLALGLGALHAASPGHGKTIMAAYLVGARGTLKHAVSLGLTVTVTHTLGVMGLGLATLYASHRITPESLYPWLGLASGGIVMAIGAWLLFGRMGDLRRRRLCHNHLHSHSPLSPPLEGGGKGGMLSDSNTLPITWRNLAALGIAGGLLPSASALVILLAAISMQRVGFGLLLILAFSAGMAGVLVGIGLLLVYARSMVERFRWQSGVANMLSRAFPVATALVVLVSGAAITVQAAWQVGLL